MLMSVMREGRVGALWTSPRAWAFAGALCTRGAGFLASFSLARYAGPTVLALYISTVITLSAVTLPLAQVLFNGGLMAAARAPSKRWAARLLRANASLAVLCLIPLLGVAVLMHGSMATRLVHELDASWTGMLIGAFSCGVGQVVLFLLNGTLNGLGAQLQAARTVTVVAVVMMSVSYPVVRVWGLNGAWFVLTLNTWLPVLLLWHLHRRHLQRSWRPQAVVAKEGVGSASAWQVATAEARRGLPQAGAVMATNVVGWFCSIYLVQETLGVQAMAVLAVANQWLTLSLMPATSWGGLILKEMTDLSLTPEGRQQLASTVRGQAIRNVGVTVFVVGGVLMAVPWLESAYRLQGLGLPALMVVSGLAALVMSAALVVQNALISMNKQWLWMLCAFVGLGGQALCTWIGIAHGVWAVQLGLLISALLSGGLALWWARRERWLVKEGVPCG